MKTNKVKISLVLLVFGFLFMSNTKAQTLNPPTDLNYTIEDQNDVILFWTQPDISGDSAYLHWDSGENHDSYGFLLGPAEWCAANRWDTSNLAPYDGWEMTKVRFFLVNQPWKLKIKIWVGNNPAEVYSQDVSVDEYEVGVWSEVAITTPFVIDASEEVRVGLYFDMTYSGTVMGLDEGPEVDGYGNWYLWNNTWYKNAAANWNLQVLTVKPSEPVTLHWDNGHKDVNAFGFETSSANYACAAKWDPSHLAPFDGWKIKSMRFYLQYSSPTKVQLKIWEGPTHQEVYSQDVTNFNLDDWSEITLDTPFAIDASKEMYAGIYVEVPGPAHVIGADDGPLIDGYGFWLYYNNNWYTAQEAGMPYNMNLQLNLDNNGKGGEKGLLGYNVYRDNQKLNPEPISPTVYLDENLFNGTYEYYVTAVYDEGESVPSDTISVVVDMPGVYLPDSLALVDLYNQCNGPNWLDQEGWFTLPINEWHGITVDSNRVTKIQLQMNNLIGDLPESIGNLTALKDLYLIGNELTSVPQSIGNLDSLKWFWLNQNPISGIPESIGRLKKMEEFNITQTNVTSLPDSLSYLTNLEFFAMGDNTISALPEHFGNLKKLKYLFMQNNLLETLPDSFGGLESLEYLTLDDNRLISLSPNFGNMSNLMVVTMTNNFVTELPESFGNLNSLFYFNAASNQLKYLPDNFGNLKNLSVLVLSVNALQELPDSFGGLSTADTIWMSYNQLTSLPDNMGDLDDLKNLDIAYNQLVSLPESFGDMASLQKLNLSVNQIEELPSSFVGLNNLVSAFIGVNQIKEIPANINQMQKLQVLNFGDNQISEVPDALGNMPELFALSLAGNNIHELPASMGNPLITTLILDNNYLTDLPSGIYGNIYYFLYIQNNILQFGSIEPLMGNVTYFEYAPQKKFGNDTTLVIEEGMSFDFTLEVTGQFNSYQWYKNGLAMDGQNTNTLHFDAASMNDEGVYSLKVTNSVVDSLTLESNNVVLTIVTDVNDEPALSGKVYPNPVTNGYFNLDLPEYTSVSDVRIMDLTGREMKRFTNLNLHNKLEVEDLVKGLYILKINAVDGRSSSEKIVVR
jgi:Leucine-rich repeat (LRR) protein